MGEPVPSRHRRRERRRSQAAPAVEPATPPAHRSAPAAGVPAPPAHPVEATPAHPVEATPAAGVPAHPVEDAGEVGAPGGPRRKVRPRRPDTERSLRGIVGAGSSQVGVVGAMRARDAAKPTAEDVAAAERDVVIIRRHYVPPDALPGPR